MNSHWNTAAKVNERLEEIATHIQKANSVQTELEAKAKAYDNFIKAKAKRDAEIAEATEMLAHAQQAKLDLARRLHEAEAREIELIERLEELKAKEVSIE